jgi:hypothetical protein
MLAFFKTYNLESTIWDRRRRRNRLFLHIAHANHSFGDCTVATIEPFSCVDSLSLIATGERHLNRYQSMNQKTLVVASKTQLIVQIV